MTSIIHMVIDPKIFKAYDIRAIYPTQINADIAARIATSIFVFFTKRIQKHEQLTIVLSYDMRLSGEELYAKVKQTLVDLGAHVIDIGKTSTPTFYFAVRKYSYDCGIQITASHNPKEWNGMKCVVNTPDGLLKIGKSTGMDDIAAFAVSDTPAPQPAYEGKVEVKTGVLEDEVDNALATLDHPAIDSFTVVADPANAMGATYIESFFHKVNGNLIKMNFELDGSFPAHQPNPLEFENLHDLQKRVLEEKADIGIAPDGDGDRLYFIDEQGQIVTATMITSLIAREILRSHPGATILVDIRYILGVKRIVEEMGGKIGITKVGHAFITEQLTNTPGALFAGESSGHFYFAQTGNAESQVTTLAAVLSVMTREKKPLSAIVSELMRAYESGETNFKVTNAKEIIESVKEKYHDGELETLDGVSISYPDWRFNIRISNTEPLLRLNVESLDEQTMKEKSAELIQYIESLSQRGELV